MAEHFAKLNIDEIITSLLEGKPAFVCARKGQKMRCWTPTTTSMNMTAMDWGCGWHGRCASCDPGEG